jgi:hypothetical protein
LLVLLVLVFWTGLVGHVVTPFADVLESFIFQG